MPHADTFLFELLAIFVSAKLLGELFERIALPAVLGEVLAGVLLGPYAFQLVQPTPTIFSLAQLGAIFLLFSVGLETRPQDLLRVGRQAFWVALAGVALPFVFGFGYMRLRSAPLHEATFVAAAMAATSVGITARLLGDLKALQTRLARIILGAAVLDDILGLLLLAVVAGLASQAGVQWVQLCVLLAEAAAFALFLFFVGPRIVRRIHPGLVRAGTQNAPLVLSLALCLGLSAAAERIGLAAIIGAFFAGLVLAEYSPEWNLQPRIHTISEFLAPFFFFVMGAQVDVRLFRGSILIDALAIALLAALSKVLGCGLPLWREGWGTALRVGVGMTPRGEVALIVALVGLQTGMVSRSAYAIVVFMTAVTTLAAPPLLRYLFRSAREAPATDAAVAE